MFASTLLVSVLLSGEPVLKNVKLLLPLTKKCISVFVFIIKCLIGYIKHTKRNTPHKIKQTYPSSLNPKKLSFHKSMLL